MRLHNTESASNMKAFGARRAGSAIALPLVMLLPLLGGCETLDMGGFNILSTQQEIQLGEELSAEIEEQKAVLDEESVQRYVQEIGQRLAQQAPRQDVRYTFKVIDAPETVNAFALPGGYMYLYTGLMKLCENEAELAGVMAHEIGHVVARHHGERLTQQYGFDVLTRIILGDDPRSTARIAANLAGTAGFMHFSREAEREADRIAVELLWRAGYNPEAMITFMDKMRREQAAAGGQRAPAILASHPPTEERIHLLTQFIQRYPSGERARRSPNADVYQRRALEPLRAHLEESRQPRQGGSASWGAAPVGAS